MAYVKWHDTHGLFKGALAQTELQKLLIKLHNVELQ
jgi:hypothetical protein